MKLDCVYGIPPSDLSLEVNQVHLWAASLDQPDSLFQRVYGSLSVDERARAERFIFERDRKRFSICRGILRDILGWYLNVDADSIFFKYDPQGKPAIVDAASKESIYFSLSHSEGSALFAFARHDRIGVDIEYMRDIPEMENIAQRLFSKRESEIFRLLPENRKKEAFFYGWTRKEAFVKALGTGLLLPSDSFDVSFVPGEQVRLMGINGDENEAGRWSMQDLSRIPEYAGALAVKDSGFHTSYWRWEPRYLS